MRKSELGTGKYFKQRRIVRRVTGLVVTRRMMTDQPYCIIMPYFGFSQLPQTQG